MLFGITDLQVQNRQCVNGNDQSGHIPPFHDVGFYRREIITSTIHCDHDAQDFGVSLTCMATNLKRFPYADLMCGAT